MTAYYNEIDPFAAQWLRNLIKSGLIADGIVDERSIEDVRPDDLAGYSQCHFFAGIGGWSLALRLAGWPDDRPVWTGSPPCQPFSTAGKQLGKDDERHLAPVWLDLVRQCRPAIAFGEQVAAAIRHGWLDDLQDELEAENYAVGKIVLPACGVGAPHIRQRLWFVAQRVGDSDNSGSQGRGRMSERADKFTAGERSVAGRMADNKSERFNRGEESTKQAGRIVTENCSASYRDIFHERRGYGISQPCQTDSFWKDADWVRCRDGKWRPIESGTFPLVDGAAARVGRLRGYGNAIVPQAAAEVIKAAIGD